MAEGYITLANNYGLLISYKGELYLFKMLLTLLLLLLLFSVLSFALRVYREIRPVILLVDRFLLQRRVEQERWLHHVIHNSTTYLDLLVCLVLFVSVWVPTLVGKSRCKLTSLAVKHAVATTSNILFCYFLALHSYKCKARKY